MKTPFRLTGHAARTTTVAVASAAAAVALTIPGLALAHGGHAHGGGAVPPPPANPTSDSQIQNIDQVKTAIKAYYGDTVSNVSDPVDGSTMLHQFAANGAYAQQTEGIANQAEHYLAKRAHHGSWKVQAKNKSHHNAQPAIVFDIDDTTLNTYSYEIYSNFVYDPVSNAAFVNAGSATVFPAVPGMVDLEQKALSEGYTVFFLTGRPDNSTTNQKPATLANLRDAGYTVVDNQVYLKDASGATEPWLSTCAPNCSTTQYKSLTRQHIESLGYDLVDNFGDQFSDLNGGFADKTTKMPNPMYFLP